ncbi:MAG TPA: CDP-alcohol phosphatidyltransferase family protein [Kofleriaceae bacterium]
MDRFYLLAPALFLLATFVGAFILYGVLVVTRRVQLMNVKHNEVLGPFFASYLVWFVGPVERLLLGRVSPNVITSLSLVLCAITGLAIALGHLPGAVWLYVFAGICDVLDGRLARKTGKQSPAGAFFDSVCDRWGELFVFAGYGWYLHASTWLLAVFAALGGSLMVSYTRARAEGLGIQLAGGWMQRAERIVVVTGGTLIAAWYRDDVENQVAIVGVTMLVCGIASAGTALGRFIVGYRRLTNAPAEAPAAIAVKLSTR